MANYEVIGSIAVDPSFDLQPADIVCEIEAENEATIDEIISSKLREFSFKSDKFYVYDVVAVEEIDDGNLLVTLTISSLDIINDLTIALKGDNEDDVNNKITDWIDEFFDANEIQLRIASIDQI